MELPELQQGLQNIQQANTPTEVTPPAEAPWLNMDNLMQGYGNWFGNDQGLGELLLGQLRARGVDTQAATEAMLRELLQGLVDDLNMLQQQLTGFTSAVTQQMQQTQAVADSVQAAINMQQPNPISTEITPPTDAQMPIMNDMPPEQPVMEQPPAEQPVMEQPPAEQPPAEQPVMEQPPAEQSPAEQPVMEQPPAEGTPSDKRIKYVLSDAGLKQIKQRFKSKNSTGINSNILAACQGGF